ncbi:homoserine kinase [Nocardioides daphniae]|uniref:Homoserine kinase n=1 Tax=Nocardioides daphniae TaxID=402297 RepID=A0A4P7UG17_9ACTN|nr:homoserine kinase [Nocardioides daphniae]QCC77719.1 homoserine kinase [Nocardioides daphniae]GGD29099.1 homoserine kinase [Nocardioides daphniae]
MATFVEGPVRVTVPATSANLGPGFDALGLALGTRDELVAEVTTGGIEVDVRGQGADDVPRDESHLVVRAMRMGFRAMGAEPPGFSLVCKNVIPHTRGMGSSSAAIIGGLVLARAMVAGGQLLLDDDAIFRLAAGLEGHPDNVAPAMYGGFTIAGHDGERWFSVNVPVDPRVTTVAFVPAEPVSTKVARGLLPATVPHGDAAANAGRAALLVAALTSRPEWLLAATEDKLHQDYREPAMPESLELVRKLRADGIPAVVSGAGPTVLALTDVSSVAALLERSPAGWTARHLPVDSQGARVE